MKLQAPLAVFVSLLISCFSPGRAAAAEMPLDKARQIPPPGVKISDADREELETGTAQLKQEIDAIAKSSAVVEVAPGIAAPVVVKAATLLPDVEIFYNAVRYALLYNEFFNVNEVAKAKVLLTEGMDRASALKEGQAAWIHAPGLVVRGYVSKIDGSVQPYGLVIPGSFATDPYRKRRLDLWYHGRGETLNEINFLSDRRKSVGEFPPDDDTIVLHPYGRYCNGNRFAGEVDTFEAIDSVKKRYAIDDNRILVRGFSMGGAACWMLATHHAGLWAAAAPGAGYTETAGFLKISDLAAVPWYQQKLWHLYDSVDYAVNLFNCPTVSYSGELDAQRQAANMMAKALAGEGIELTQVIGAGAHHNYVPAAKEEITRRLDSIARHGRDPLPTHVKFTTWTLRYNSMDWVMIDALHHHWERARVDAEIVDSQTVRVTTENVAALTLRMPPGLCPLDMTKNPKAIINDVAYGVAAVGSDRSWTANFYISKEKPDATHAAIIGLDEPSAWSKFLASGLRKSHGLQGPIDDAFMDSFIFVEPTDKPLNEKTGAWVAAEMKHAVEHWRKQFRGEARVKKDSDITDADIASSNLVLWGDRSSNRLLAKIADQLPIGWKDGAVRVGGAAYPSATHIPILIYPNPLNQKRYVVLNSGFTFREYDYENNARQSPKLPDWAVVDVSVAPTAQSVGGISAAGFFGENWELTKPDSGRGGGPRMAP
ncbi:MAG TPA: prolyl oligopeptidase family serine peptidase [Tepidisphaeraceae bacterium]|nr:prolyl oligopeptidase family serine peptidase [Tepidisphaeraceae bacterium]